MNIREQIHFACAFWSFQDIAALALLVPMRVHLCLPAFFSISACIVRAFRSNICSHSRCRWSGQTRASAIRNGRLGVMGLRGVLSGDDQVATHCEE
jgi:hypothetical protein